jgi:hypothetical protein
MKHMAGRKRHSAEDIVRKLRRADELAAEGKTGEEIAASLKESDATVKKTTTPTTVPTIETTTAAMLVLLDFPVRNSPTMPRTNAMGSSTHPTTSAPGMQAKMNPMMLAISAMSPTMFVRFADAAAGSGADVRCSVHCEPSK